jgi:hypothetical protein
VTQSEGLTSYLELGCRDFNFAVSAVYSSDCILNTAVTPMASSKLLDADIDIERFIRV